MLACSSDAGMEVSCCLMLESSFNSDRKRRKCKIKIFCFFRGLLFGLPLMALILKYVTFKMCLNKM